MTQEEKLIEYLKHSASDKDITPVGINERSLMIFGDEKYMASKEGRKLTNRVLKKYNINRSYLKIYKTDEPFIFIRTDKDIQDAVIVENKDTFGTFRKRLLDGDMILGRKFGALIYGEGRKIQSSFKYIRKEEGKELDNIENFYYFGDIDSEGIDIFNKLKARYPEYQIKAFSEAYRFLYINKDKMRRKNKSRTQKIFFWDVKKLETFTDKECNEIRNFCNEGMIIPQEVLNQSVLKDMAA